MDELEQIKGQQYELHNEILRLKNFMEGQGFGRPIGERFLDIPEGHKSLLFIQLRVMHSLNEVLIARINFLVRGVL
jgi:hypothetical protein